VHGIPLVRARADASFLRNRYREGSREVSEEFSMARLKKRDRDSRRNSRQRFSRGSTMQRNLTSLDARYRAALLPLPPGRCSPCNSNSRIRADEPIAERLEDRSEPSERFTFTSTITRRGSGSEGSPAESKVHARAERRGGRRRVLRCGSLANDD